MADSETTNNGDHGWLQRPLQDPNDIERYYDDWVGSYNATLESWGYDAPVVASQLVFEAIASRVQASLSTAPSAGLGTVDRAMSVLDVGCGTGMCGLALQALGFTSVDGIDLSQVSLDAAASTGTYRTTTRLNLDQLPLPFDDHSYSAALSVGVLSYVPALRPLFVDLARILVPNAPFVFTQRQDLWIERDTEQLLADLLADGTFAAATWTDPRPYMPGNADFSDQIGVRYVSMLTPPGPPT